MRVAIIGLGLMGGSLALSLKSLPFIKEIVGMDHNPAHQKEALALQLVERIVEIDEVKSADIIILAIPVNGVIQTFELLQDVNEKCTIIDLGSTKEIIVNAVPKCIRKNFVAAHPMTGTENFGPSAAIEGLYKDKVVVLCNLEESGIHQQETSVRLFSGIHMNLHYMKAHEHDRHAAFISHLPHAISYSLANVVLAQEDKESILTLAAGGFRSMSRLAKSSPHMWEDIFRQNKKNMIESIELFEDELANMKKMIKEDRFDAVHERMHNANKLQEIFN